MYRSHFLSLLSDPSWCGSLDWGQVGNQRVAGSIPSQAHAWGGGQVPSRGDVRGNHTLMFFSFSFSFPSPLPKNKWIKSLTNLVICWWIFGFLLAVVKNAAVNVGVLNALWDPALNSFGEWGEGSHGSCNFLRKLQLGACPSYKTIYVFIIAVHNQNYIMW